MKKKISLPFVMLLCIGQIIFAEREMVFQPKPCCNHQQQSSCAAPCFDMTATSQLCCKRGKRGPRGKRGRRGPSGECGLGELFINAQMMSWTPGEFPVRIFPPSNSFALFPPIGTFIYTWDLFPSVISAGLPPIGAVFKIPVDLDRTKPVRVIVHFLVDSSEDVTGTQAKIQIDMDYQFNNGILGSTPPATGFADTQVSAEFTVIPAVPGGSDNHRQIQTTAIELDPSAIDGEWAFIGVRRIAPVINEFSGNLLLSTISVQYSRICS